MIVYFQDYVILLLRCTYVINAVTQCKTLTMSADNVDNDAGIDDTLIRKFRLHYAIVT